MTTTVTTTATLAATTAPPTFRRRQLLRGLTGLAAGLTIAGAGAVPVAGAAVGDLCPYCGVAPYGPLHRYLHASSPAPIWADQIIARESRWVGGATNPASGAAGLAQFMPSTWQWGEARFGLYGSPYDPIAAIDMMNAFLRAGEYYHWNCNGEC